MTPEEYDAEGWGGNILWKLSPSWFRLWIAGKIVMSYHAALLKGQAELG